MPDRLFGKLGFGGGVPLKSLKSERLTGIAQTVLLTMAGLTSGFLWKVYFPLANNTFHVPIVLRYFESAEGPHDPYHKSLAGLVSWFWPIVSLVVTEQNIETVFVAGAIVARTLTILAIFFLIASAARRSWELALFMALLSFVFPWPYVFPLGGGEIIAPYLTHSQYAHALCIIAIALAAGQRWWPSVFLCGVVFNINLFLAFWTVVVIVGTRTVLGYVSDRRLAFRFLIGAPAMFVILALPTLYWILTGILSAPEYRAFPFVTFLYTYYPYHTYIHLKWPEAVIFLLASFAVLLLWSRISRVNGGLKNLGFLFGVGTMVFLLGSFAAYTTDSRIFLSLQSLRFSSVIAVVGTSLFVALLETVRETVEKDHQTLSGADLSPTGFVHLIERIFSFLGNPTVICRMNILLSVIVGILMIRGLIAFSFHGFAPSRGASENNEIAVQQWARRNTPLDTLFYAHDIDGFSTLSRRPVWWSQKEGGVVMWAPWFHEQWETRRKLVRQVETLQDLIDLARRERIAYVVITHPMMEYAIGQGISFVYRNPDFGVVANNFKGG